MPLKPQSRSYSSPLPDFAPVLLRVETPIEAVKDARDPDKELVLFRFTVLTPPWSNADPPHSERQRHGNTVNPKQDGTPSLLAQLINAAHPADLSKAEMLDFDLEQLAGRTVEAIGRIKEDERGRFWNVVTYRRPQHGLAQQMTPPADEYKYTEDRKHRWKPGMAAWEPVPQAAPPPPPPPPPAVPPPPPTAAPPPPAPSAASPPAPEIKF